MTHPKVLLFALLLAVPLSATGPRFKPDDPIAREPDPGDASRVQPFPIHLTWDLMSSLVIKEGDRTPRRAQDLNTIGEVPDSSWYTNRAGLTVNDVERGPDTTDGPAGLWTVVSGKSEGVRPGFTIRDSAGIVWFVKFDEPGHPEEATGAEVVSTKLFWALGYDVAETHVAKIWRPNVVMSPDATFTVNGRRRRLTEADVDRVFAQVDRGHDGSYRALASKALDGKPVGGFLYYGTRPDDPNDVVPHENRRELRAMGVFAAWIDRVDAKAGNTLDTLVTLDDGKAVVRHHPLDFGATLGSGGVEPNEPWESYEYLYSGQSLARKFAGFGFPVESWRRIRYPHIRGIGQFEADHFDPDAWRSRVPNAAYIRADAEDKFWAARKLAGITADMIAAAVRSGDYSDKAAEDYLTRTLIERRDAILRRYLPAVNPIVNPSLDMNGTLTFQNAAVMADVAVAPTEYRAAWYSFDNFSDSSELLGTSESRTPIMAAPIGLPSVVGSFARIDIEATSQAQPSWSTPVSVFFRRDDKGWMLVGLSRE